MDLNLNRKRKIGILVFTLGAIIVSIGIVSALSIGTLSVKIVDTAGEGIEGADIYVFDEGLGLPEDAIFSGVTDADGTIVCANLTGFLGVGVVAEGYTSDHNYTVFGMDTEIFYAYYGGCGVVEPTHIIVLDGEGPEPEPVVVDPDTIPDGKPYTVSSDDPTVAKPLPTVAGPLPWLLYSGVAMMASGGVLWGYDPLKEILPLP